MGTILVTGGAGYIGSHTCVELLEAGHRVVVLDNLCNSKPAALARVERITGRPLAFVRGDVRDAGLDALLREQRIEAVIHFAGLKAVGESVAQPLDYFDNNVSGSLNLVRAMQRAGVRRLVFSSSATVYGNPHSVPIREDAPLDPTNPYGRSKRMVEDMLRDLASSAPEWGIALLRYFNPVGAHESGLIGEDPMGTPANLMPYVCAVAVGRAERVRVFGNDYPTPDGTGVRDYIHVSDLAQGHLKALAAIARGGLHTLNLGTGKGYSVLEILAAFEKVSGSTLPFEIAPRRPGDVAACFADAAHAEKTLGWRATRGLEQMCADAWRWARKNPRGYTDSPA